MNALASNAIGMVDGPRLPPVEHLADPLVVLCALLAADREHDAARQALIDLNQRIANHGWIDLEADALRQASTRFVSAQARRTDLLDRLTNVHVAPHIAAEAARA